VSDLKMLAESCVYDLFNDADHVSQLTQNAQVALAHGDYVTATKYLSLADRPAGRIAMRLRHALNAVERAAAEVKNV
jgi:hypothetical protein